MWGSSVGQSECERRRTDETPASSLPLHSSLQPRWRNDRQDGAHDLPRGQGKDMACKITPATSMLSSRVSRNSSEAQKELDATHESDNE